MSKGVRVAGLAVAILAAVAAILVAVGGGGSAAEREPVPPATPDASVAIDPTSELEGLRTALEAVASTEAGVVGGAVTHIESGHRISVNGAALFPMHSVSKLPIAVVSLKKVDRGELRLDDEVTVTADDLAPTMAGPKDRWAGLPLKRTIRRLLELSLVESDNTAVDKLIALSGGTAEVRAELRNLGITGVDISRSTKQMALDFCVGENATAIAAEKIVATCRALSAESLLRARRREDARGLDSAKPDVIADLLVDLYKGTLLAAPSRGYLLETMYGSRVGAGRLKGQLPAGTQVAHKTGTGYFATNDVGIIDLPADRGHLVVAAFIKESTRRDKAQEQTIANLARVAYDFFVQRPPARDMGQLRLR
jgi:beta-lactamase class A